MNSSLNEILTEVLTFPYEQSLVDSLEQACSKYVEEIDLDKYEACVLHLCLDMPSYDLIQSVNTQTNKRYPTRVYRAFAGYVIGRVLSMVSDEYDKVMYSLALRNVLKVKDNDANGIICKSIEPSCFAVVEEYWKHNALIPSLSGEEIISTVFDAETWYDIELNEEDSFSDIQSLAKFYCRGQFEKKYLKLKVPENQDMYVFANQVANEMASQDWLFTAEIPYDTLKSLGIKGSAISLNNIKDRIHDSQNTVGDDINNVSVFRRYLFSNDYEKIGSHRFSPQNFGIAIFYELLYERLKSDKHE